MRYLMYSHNTGVSWQRSLLSRISRKTAAVMTTAVAAAALVVAPVFAHAPSVNITAINGLDATSGTVSFSVPSLPTTVNVDGTATHDDPGNLDGVKLSLSDNGVVFYPSNNYWSGIGNVGTAPFTVPWTITAAGAHTIVVTVSHGNADGTDTVDVTINLNVVVTECPAAPAVAADLLRLHNVKPKLISDKNYISSVAHQMGPQNSFNGVGACDAGYRDAVDTYLHTVLHAY